MVEKKLGVQIFLRGVDTILLRSFSKGGLILSSSPQTPLLLYRALEAVASRKIASGGKKAVFFNASGGEKQQKKIFAAGGMVYHPKKAPLPVSV